MVCTAGWSATRWLRPSRRPARRPSEPRRRWGRGPRPSGAGWWPTRVGRPSSVTPPAGSGSAWWKTTAVLSESSVRAHAAEVRAELVDSLAAEGAQCPAACSMSSLQRIAGRRPAFSMAHPWHIRCPAEPSADVHTNSVTCSFRPSWSAAVLRISIRDAEVAGSNPAFPTRKWQVTAWRHRACWPSVGFRPQIDHRRRGERRRGAGR